jgi:hypothetical protein
MRETLKEVDSFIKVLFGDRLFSHGMDPSKIKDRL